MSQFINPLWARTEIFLTYLLSAKLIFSKNALENEEKFNFNQKQRSFANVNVIRFFQKCHYKMDGKKWVHTQLRWQQSRFWLLLYMQHWEVYNTTVVYTPCPCRSMCKVRYFHKWPFSKQQLPYGFFPSGNFPNVQFPKRQLPKPVLAALQSLRKPNLTFEK